MTALFILLIFFYPSFSYSGPCNFPDDLDSAGRRCGKRAASVKPSGTGNNRGNKQKKSRPKNTLIELVNDDKKEKPQSTSTSVRLGGTGNNRGNKQKKSRPKNTLIELVNDDKRKNHRSTSSTTVVWRSPCEHDETTFRCVEYVRNYDGDTVTFNIPSVHPLFGKHISVRILNVDTAEINTSNECEKRKAIQAKQEVENLLKQAQRIDLHNVKRGKYFRIVADIKADGISIGDFLINHNLAYYYSGGRKPNLDWCSL